MTEQTINVENVGPVERLTIQVPAEGGVCVLRGRNGSGKSTALEAAEALAGKPAKLSTRDGTRGVGRVDGLGATVILGRKTTRSGELEVASLEGRVSIADLVQPPIKDPAAADRQRIKALVSLTGVEPSATMFREVVGDSVDDLEIDWGGDVVEVAGRAKRALEAKARAIEKEADVREGQAKNAEEAVKDLDETAEHDEGKLRAAHLEAASAFRSLRDQADAHAAASNRIDKARAKLEKARAAYTGPTVEEAEIAEADARKVKEDADADVADLERRLRDARTAALKAGAGHDAAVEATMAARRHAETVASYEEMLDSALPKPVDIEALEAAARAANAAADAVERGALIRQALARSADAGVFRKTAQRLAEKAEALRTAASQIDDALSRSITCPLLYVQDGRLIAQGHARGDVPYAELSEGERWAIAFDAVAPVVGERGLIVLPQGAWEGLDIPHRKQVAELAKKYKITVLTAEATDGDIVCEPFED